MRSSFLFAVSQFGLGCFLAGLALGNAVTAWEEGRGWLWSGIAVVGGLGFAFAWLAPIRRAASALSDSREVPGRRDR